MVVTVTDSPAESRYELRTDGELAAVALYRLDGNVASFVHTETLPGYSGQGFAGRLVQEALDDARRRGWQVLPICPYVRSYIEKHPEYTDLVPERDRAAFDLA